MFERLRHLLLGRWAEFTCDHPRWVLTACLLLAGAAVWLTLSHLTFEADRNLLIRQDLPWNQRYLDYRRQFHGHDSIVVVVKVPPGQKGRRYTEQFVQFTADRLQDHDQVVRNVWYGFSQTAASGKLIRLLPQARFEQTMEQLRLARPLLQAGSVGQLLQSITRQMASQRGEAASVDAESGEAMIGTLDDLLSIIGDAARGALQPDPFSQLNIAGASQWQYLTSDDGELMFIDIEPRRIDGILDPFQPAVDATRAVLLESRQEYSDIEAGMTGMPVIEADETSVSMRDSTVTSVIAVVAIAALLIFAFHSFRMPTLMVLSLGLGIAWSYGYLTLAIGHLQVLSVVFTVILLGLGIDFGIHLVSRFEMTRHNYPEGLDGFRRALGDTFETTGPGIITGAMTTAAAFGATLVTDFRGMAEMGHIAAVGVLLCLLAMFAALPSLMRLFRKNLRHVKPMSERPIDLHGGAWLLPLSRHPFITTGVALALVGLGAAAMTQVRYDNNLQNLLPEEMESLRWLDELESHEVPLWSAASVASSLEEARARVQQFRELPTVEDVGGIGYLFPRNLDQKLQITREIRQELAPALAEAENPDADTTDTPAQLAQQITTLRLALTFALQRSDVQANPEIEAALRQLLQRVSEIGNAMSDPAFLANAEQRVAALNEAFDAWRRDVIDQLSEAVSLDPLMPEDLPPYLRLQAISVTEPTRYLIQVHPRSDIWQGEVMEPFIQQVRSVDPNITGSPVQIYESGKLMQRAYQIAGALALAAVFLLTYMDFLRLVDALLCLLPVTVGFICTFALMWAAGVTLNPANIIVLPLLFGIGVSSGVHVMHRYKQARYARPLGLTSGTMKGVILTSLTTIIAFSTMLLAKHRGIQSLGFVLSIGISLTLIATLLIMPAVLELRNRYHVVRRYRRWQALGGRENRRTDQ